MLKRAKYNREQRFRMYRQIDKKKYTVVEICQIFGISRKTYYKWKKRDYGEGDNRYRSPQSQPKLKLTYDVKLFIEKSKLKTNYGPLKMKLHVKRELGINLSTTIIYRYYKRKGLIRKPQKKLPWYKPMKAALVIKRPGEGVQMDIKYVYPRGKREYQFSVFDPFTKKYYFKVFPTKKSVNAIKAFQKAQKYFGFTIFSIQTDNGSEFRGEFHRWLTKMKIYHYFIPKKSPWWNGNIERVHRTIDDEFYQNPWRVWKTPKQWLRYYNFERIHLALGGITPQEKLTQCVTLDC